jgi:hypothetical protein
VEWFNFTNEGELAMNEEVTVYTSKGLLPRSVLEVRDVITETENSRCIATEWYYNGELVRRSAWADLFRTKEMSGAQPQL